MSVDSWSGASSVRCEYCKDHYSCLVLLGSSWQYNLLVAIGSVIIFLFFITRLTRHFFSSGVREKNKRKKEVISGGGISARKHPRSNVKVGGIGQRMSEARGMTSVVDSFSSALGVTRFVLLVRAIDSGAVLGSG